MTVVFKITLLREKLWFHTWCALLRTTVSTQVRQLRKRDRSVKVAHYWVLFP